MTAVFDSQYSSGTGIFEYQYYILLPNKLIIPLSDNAVSFMGKKINSGSVNTNIGSVKLENAGNEGLNASLSSIFDSNIFLSSGAKGNPGVINTQIQNLIDLIVGVKGNTSNVNINIFTSSELFAKIGTTGQLNMLLDDLEVRLIEIVITDEIFNILVSMKTGQITILGPKTGTINIERLS